MSNNSEYLNLLKNNERGEELRRESDCVSSDSMGGFNDSMVEAIESMVHHLPRRNTESVKRVIDKVLMSGVAVGLFDNYHITTYAEGIRIIADFEIMFNDARPNRHFKGRFDV